MLPERNSTTEPVSDLIWWCNLLSWSLTSLTTMGCHAMYSGRYLPDYRRHTPENGRSIVMTRTSSQLETSHVNFQINTSSTAQQIPETEI
jgi:hypothetical protein